MYYKVLLQYYSVLQSTTLYYTVLQRTTPVLLCTTKYYYKNLLAIDWGVQKYIFFILVYILLSYGFSSFRLLFIWIFIFFSFWFSFLFHLDLHPSEWLLIVGVKFSPKSMDGIHENTELQCVKKKGSRDSEISFKIDGGNNSKSTKMNTLREIQQNEEKNKIKMNK